jgi:hypothetical protein
LRNNQSRSASFVEAVPQHVQSLGPRCARLEHLKHDTGIPQRNVPDGERQRRPRRIA